MKTRRGTTWLGVGVAPILWSGAASADIQTFWKTYFCPDFGGLKPAIASEVGHMEAPVDPFGGGVGGAICVTESASLTAGNFSAGTKNYDVFNADVVFSPGDVELGMGGVPGAVWDCIVCQYEDKVFAHPALSIWGTAVLMGGVVTAMIVELRRRRDPGSV